MSVIDKMSALDKLASQFDLGIDMSELDKFKGKLLNTELEGLTATRRDLWDKVRPVLIALVVGVGAAAFFSTFTVEAKGTGFALANANRGDNNRLNLDAEDPLLMGSGDGAGPDPKDGPWKTAMNMRHNSDGTSIMSGNLEMGNGSSIMAGDGFATEMGVGKVSVATLSSLDNPYLGTLDQQAIRELADKQITVPNGPISWIEFTSEGNRVAAPAQEGRRVEGRSGYMGLFVDGNGVPWVVGADHNARLGAIIPGLDSGILTGQLIAGEGPNAGFLGLFDQTGTFQPFLKVGGSQEKGYAVASVVVGGESMTVARYESGSLASVDTQFMVGGVEANPNSAQLDIIFTDTHELNVAGVPIIGATSVDVTARGFGLHELTIGPSTLDDLAARALHNFFVPGSPDNVTEATTWLGQCKDGATAERTEAVYTTTGDTEPETLKMVMNCGGESIPEGTVPINRVEFVYGRWSVQPEGDTGGVFASNPEMPWTRIIAKDFGIVSGLLVDKEDGTLKIFVGMEYIVNTDKLPGTVSTNTEIALEWLLGYPNNLSLGSGNSQYNKAKTWMNAVSTK